MKCLLILSSLAAVFALNSAEINPHGDLSIQPARQYMNPMAMTREQFPIDYSMQCSDSCKCIEKCQLFWWMSSCTSCKCPPPCIVASTQAYAVRAETVTVTGTPKDPVPTDKPTDGPTQGPITPPPGDCNCCGGCMCQPCMIWWMCPPRCPTNCCNSNSCCNRG